jgi:Holliday junction DNA helicase RuvA
MIGRLTGRVVAQEDEGALVVDVGGVGYEVVAPLGTIGRATEDAEGRVTLFVHTHVREEALALFGFATEPDRLAFRTLIGVSSVGPKTAIAVLSALPAPELARAIANKDVGRLTSISGIGKKTAERLLLELRDKLPLGAAAVAAGQAGPARPRSHGGRNEDTLAAALTSMGYKPIEAERALGAIGPRVAEAPLQELLREALAILAK